MFCTFCVPSIARGSEKGQSRQSPYKIRTREIAKPILRTVWEILPSNSECTGITCYFTAAGLMNPTFPQSHIPLLPYLLCPVPAAW